ncbi:MAG TPA: ribonuclease HI family protein [Candidatus Dormibacteraeota bacterium]|nr:ribonuclease HI family protein [Candidatus Dormibacteraeota bacterium]
MTGADSVVIHTDGASRGNPGPASIGVVIAGQDGRVLVEFGEALRPTTNNVAEYTAVVRALERAAELEARRVRMMMDSQLVVRQLNGSYRVKHADMIPLYRRVLDLIQKFESVTFEHVPREQNVEADRLANQALDGGAVEDAPLTNESIVARVFKSLIDSRSSDTVELLEDRFIFQRAREEGSGAKAFLSKWQGAGKDWEVDSVRGAGSDVILEAARGKIAIVWLCRVVGGKVERITEYRDSGR